MLLASLLFHLFYAFGHGESDGGVRLFLRPLGDPKNSHLKMGAASNRKSIAGLPVLGKNGGQKGGPSFVRDIKRGSVPGEGKKICASSGNRTRAARVAGEHSTTEPTMLRYREHPEKGIVSSC